MSNRSLTSMKGRDVVAVDNAESIGTVKHFVVSRAADRIERLHIDGRKKNAVFVEWSDLESFGADRVMVSAASAPRETENERDADAAKGDIDLIGARILDAAGFEHGEVDDGQFDSDTGRIVSVTSTNGDVIDASRIQSLGSYALVVSVE